MVLYAQLEALQSLGVVLVDGIRDDWVVRVKSATIQRWLVRGNRKQEHIRPTTRACSAALFPVCATPSSLQIFLRSLLMRVRERSVMVAASCCRLRLVAMADCSCAVSLISEGRVVEVVVDVEAEARCYQVTSARESIGGSCRTAM